MSATDNVTTTRGVRRSGRRRLRWIGGGAFAVGIIVATVVLVTWWVMGRDDPSQFEGAVSRVEERYDGNFPQNGVLLVGSSTFEYWETSRADLAPLATENVGLRQTKVGDQIAFVDRLVVPFDPVAVVLYTGSNDINGLPLYSKSGAETAGLIGDYIDLLTDRLPDTRIYVVGIVETPARVAVRSDVQEANALLAERATTSPDYTFIDTTPLLLSDGSIDTALFRDDDLHFNDAGYAALTAILRTGLAAEL